MFNVYKVVITFDTGMEHVDDVDGEWKTEREAVRAWDRLTKGWMADAGLTNEVKVVDALDLVVFLAQKGDSGRLAMVRP
jgi:hypothetical protein